jgi:tetratricopeptide (TPR) repeat protein
LISEYDALRFIFGFYKLPFDPEITVEKLTQHYKIVSSKIGYQMLPPEQVVNETGYYYLGDKKFEKALSFFQLNVKYYPGSQNVYDSMGDYYAAVDDKPKAIEFFKKALEIGQSEYTRKKLEDLEKETSSSKP